VIDLTELQRITAAIAASGVTVRTEGRAVVSRGALNIKNEWRDNARSSAGAHARLYPNSISYDLTSQGAVVEAVIGPDKDKVQGPLGNLLEFGSAHNPPHNDGGRALDSEEPRFVAQVEALADRAAGL
jgi:hypothetical protein